MKKAKVLLVALMTSLVLLGCQGGLSKTYAFSPDQSSIFVNKDNQISSALVESYQSDIYDQEELKEYIEQAVIAYNSANGAAAAAVNVEGVGKLPVALKSCTLENQKAVAVFEYASPEDFIQFTAETNDTANHLEAISISTVADGIPPEFSFLSAKDQTKADQSEITKKGEWHVVSLEGTATVQTEGKILFISSGVTLQDNYTAVTSEEKSCIIFE